MTSFGNSLLVIGGARSGKSRHAQAQAEALPGDLLYIATAQAYDDEMRAKIDRHRADRGPRWRTVEAPLALAEAIVAAERPVLVDCLTLWASNLLLSGEDPEPRLAALLAAIAAVPFPCVLVTNEVGMGIVPDNALSRRFRELAGEINQRVAAAVDSVDLAVAGLTLPLKRR